MRRIGIALLLALAVAACGKKQPLRPADNAALPVKPRTAAAQPTPDQLLTPGAQARPTRFNELLTKSQELQSDRFDMPPPG
ncbi:hypothetical protein [Sphingomonas sp.]|uniref:hypothetical protein n=1 Tax=Sphingomonas sp. TaxID=28214 RepID=UPI003B00B699